VPSASYLCTSHQPWRHLRVGAPAEGPRSNLGDGRQDGDHQLAGRASRVDPLTAHAEHDQTDATAIQVVHDPQEVCGAPGKTIGLAADQRDIPSDEAQGFLEPIALCQGGDLLGEYFLTARRLEVADLGVESGLLVTGCIFRLLRMRLERSFWAVNRPNFVLPLPYQNVYMAECVEVVFKVGALRGDRRPSGGG
jgi:hypothetical protein